MKASDVFVQALEAEGVKYVFGIGGEENLDLMESLRNSSIMFIPTRHEQAAGFMAATYGRLTGVPGVALSTLGPGATNLVTAAAYAHLGAMPMIILTGQKPIGTAPQGSFQKVDVVAMMNPLTKFANQIVHSNTIPTLIRKAFSIAEQERPGPVHLELPMDVAGVDIDREPLPIPKSRRPIAEYKAINWAIEMIKEAKHPLILLAAGANRKLVSNMVTELVDKLGIPFFTSQMGSGVIDERHPLFLGTAALSANDYLHDAIEKSDLIINIGHDVIEKPAFLMKKDGAKVIHMNFYPAIPDEIYFPQLEVVGDIANALWQIKEALEPQKHWDFSYFMKVKDVVEKELYKDKDNNSFPVKPQRIINDVRAFMPEDGIVALDNGMYKLWFTRLYKTYTRNSLLLDNALATMGAGLPSAIAAKLVYPDRKVLCVAGDGGFMMNSQELETAVRLGLDLVVLLVRDDAYGMIKWKQSGDNYHDFGLDFGNPDFVKYAESYGAKGYRVEKADDLSELLEKSFSSKGVHLIDCPIDYADNDKIFTDDLKNRKPIS